MRNFLLGLLIGSLVITALAAMPQLSRERETIRVGDDLTLGMSEDAAVKKLAESGYKLRQAEPPKGLRDKGVTSMWIIDDREDKRPSLGVITFASGRLNSAMKPLLPPDGDEVEFGMQLYFAMRDLELEGDSRCTLRRSPLKYPSTPPRPASCIVGRRLS